jgi:hypothetical protein
MLPRLCRPSDGAVVAEAATRAVAVELAASTPAAWHAGLGGRVAGSVVGDRADQPWAFVMVHSRIGAVLGHFIVFPVSSVRIVLHTRHVIAESCLSRTSCLHIGVGGSCASSSIGVRKNGLRVLRTSVGIPATSVGRRRVLGSTSIMVLGQSCASQRSGANTSYTSYTGHERLVVAGAMSVAIVEGRMRG